MEDYLQKAWGRIGSDEATSCTRRDGREVEGPRDPLDLGPVASVAPDPGDQPWGLDVIPTAHCQLPCRPVIHMDLVG